MAEDKAPLTRPSRYLTRMAVFVALVAGIAALLSPALYGYFMGNPAVNGVILGILVAGIIYIFRQVMRLNPEVAWIERFRRNQANLSSEDMPRLLSPMATMLGDRRGGSASGATRPISRARTCRACCRRWRPCSATAAAAA